MQLTATEEGWLGDVSTGIQTTGLFIGELTDYHGEPVSTEYILTVHIARALLERAAPRVAVEYLVNRIEGHALIRDRAETFSLGSQRFDVAILDEVAPVFVVEVKIGVVSLARLTEDLRKIMAYLQYLKPTFACRVLGACVFQTHVQALGQTSLEETTRRIHAIEGTIQAGLREFSTANPLFEFEWRPFQGQNEGIVDDEQTEDIDGAPMLDRLGYAARYHAILVRRRPTPAVAASAAPNAQPPISSSS